MLINRFFSVSQEDPTRTVQIFIDLVQRHEQAFYSFVHRVHSKGEGLFTSLMQWIELFLTFVREGLGRSVSLEFLLPHTGQERMQILAEVDSVAQYHYKLKVIHEDKLRRRFGRAQKNQSEADLDDEATQALLNGIAGDLAFGDLVQGDAEDLAAADSDDDDSDSEEYETASSDEEGESEDDSSESADESRVPRSQTSRETSARPPPSRSQTRSRPPDSRKRAAATPGLKHSRSMNFAISKRSKDLPPVPPLPASPQHKPLPPIYPSTAPPDFVDGKKPKLRRRRNRHGLKPPELTHIPQLLPVFKEIVSV
jgi:hypothetical protein